MDRMLLDLGGIAVDPILWAGGLVLALAGAWAGSLWRRRALMPMAEPPDQMETAGRAEFLARRKHALGVSGLSDLLPLPLALFCVYAPARLGLLDQLGVIAALAAGLAASLVLGILAGRLLAAARGMALAALGAAAALVALALSGRLALPIDLCLGSVGLAHGGLWWLAQRLWPGKVRMRELLWTAKALELAEQWTNLGRLLPRLASNDPETVRDLQYMRAEVAERRGDEAGAIQILSSLDPWVQGDQMLIRLHGQQGKERLDVIVDRALCHEAREAVGLVEQLQPGSLRETALARVLAAKGQWEMLRVHLSKLPRAGAIKILGRLPATSRRDGILAGILAGGGQFREMAQALAGYEVEEALGLLQAQFPDPRASLPAVINLLARRGSEGLAALMRELEPQGLTDALNLLRGNLSGESLYLPATLRLLAHRGQEEIILELLLQVEFDKAVRHLGGLPDQLQADRILCQMAVADGREQYLHEHFQGRTRQRAIEALGALAPGLVRERLLAPYYVAAGLHEKVVDRLSPYYRDGQLEGPDLLVLAKAHLALAQDEPALYALETAWDLGLRQDEVVEDLVRLCLKLGQASLSLAEVGDGSLEALGAKARKSLMAYYRHFGMAESCDRVAVFCWERDRDPEAALQLGRSREAAGRFAEAARSYEGAGEEGQLPRARCLFSGQDYAAAAAAFRALKPLAGRAAMIQYHLGYCLYRAGDAAGALDAYLEALEAETDQERRTALRVDVRRLRAVRAAAAMTEGDWNEALKQVQEAWADYENDPDGPDLADLWQTGGNERAYEKLAVGDALAWMLAREAREALAGTRPSLERARQMLALAAGLPKAVDRKALAMLTALVTLGEGRMADAQAEFAQLAAGGPGHRQARFHQGLAAALAGELDQAGEVLGDLAYEEVGDAYAQRARLALAALAIGAGEPRLAERHLADQCGKPDAAAEGAKAGAMR